jgi:ketosteroid isomerase-like protein
VTPAAISELADRLFAAIEAGDPDTVAQLYAPDATVWHNFDQLDQSREQNVATLGWLCRRVPERRYEEIRRVITPDGFVQQHVLRGTMSDGAALEVPAMMRVYCADGHITRIEEYLDTAQTVTLAANRDAGPSG